MASKPKAEYEIRAKDESKKGIKSAQGGLKNLSKGAKSSFAIVAKAAVAATAAVVGVGLAANKVVKMYAEQEKAEIKLAAASRNNPLINGDAVKSLIDYSAALQQASIFGDELLINQASFLTTLQLSEDQIRGVLSAATDLASTGMMSLDSAVKNIAKTYGGMAGELGELIPQLRNLTAEQLKNGEAVDLIAKNYEGMAESVAKSTYGIDESTKNLFGDMLETVGETLAPIKNKILIAIQPAFDRIIQWFQKNQKPITNFFLNFGTIVSKTFEWIGESLIKMFSFGHAWESIKALGEYMGIVWKNTFKSMWAVVKAIGTTMWVPLSNGFDYVVYGMKVAWTTTMNVLKKGLLWFIDGPVDGLGKAFRKVVNGIGDAIGWILNGLVSLIDGVVSGLNKIVEAAFKAKEFLAHPIDASKRKEFDPSILPSGFEKTFDFDWMDKEVGKLSERIGGLTEALDPKDITLIKNNAQSMEEAMASIKDAWANAGDQTVESYVENMKAALDMNKKIFAQPFIDGFDEFAEEFKGVLMSDLPPTAIDIVETLQKESEDAVKKAYGNSVPGLRRDFEVTLSGIMGEIFGNIKAAFGEGGSLEEVGVALSSIGSALMTFGKYLLDGLMATEAFTSAMTVLSEGISRVFNALIVPLMTVLRPIVGILIQFANVLGAVLMPLMIAVAQVLEALMPIISMLGDFLAQLLVPIVDVLAIALGIITDLLVQLTPVFKILFEMILNILTPVLEFLGQILTALAPVFQLIGDILLAIAPVLEAIGIIIGDILGPALTFIADLFSAIINPIMTVFAQIMMVLTPIFKIFAIIMKAITPIFNILFQFMSFLLIPLQTFGTLLTALNPLFMLLGGIISLLVPVFEFLALVIDAVTRPLEFFADMITYVVDVLGVVAHNIGQFFLSVISFGMAGGDFKAMPTFQSTAFSRPLGQSDAATITTPDFADITFADNAGDANTSTGYAPQGASYGSNQLTVNVAINTEVVVGEPGLRELALMIDDEINSARQLGIA